MAVRLHRTTLVIAFALSGTAACNTSHSAAEHELRAMAKADQVARTPPNEADPVADEIRQQRVLALLASGEIRDAESLENAALILQHSGLSFCNGKLTAISRDNYLLASLLARAAVDKGRQSARGLAAVTLDRYLVFSGKAQKYGTQTVLDPTTNKMVVPPIDPATTDAERATWHVEPLAVFLKRVRAENSP